MTMQFVKDVPFKNWTESKFTMKYAGEDYSFEAGGTYNVPSDVADHFAKHLAISELHRQADLERTKHTNIDEKSRAAAIYEALPETLMKEYTAKCFPNKDKHPSVSNSFDRIDVKDSEAVDSKPVAENKTEAVAQSETSIDDDADASDDKNNAGAPIIKGIAKTKDKQYKR